MFKPKKLATSVCDLESIFDIPSIYLKRATLLRINNLLTNNNYYIIKASIKVYDHDNRIIRVPLAFPYSFII